MYDQYNRTIDYLRLSVTDNCNLNCFYCMPTNKQRTTEMSDEKIISVVKAAVNKGIKKIRVTGGEPLVRQGIYELLKKIKAVNGVEELTLTTNGTLLFDNVHLLKESNVDRINLSIDSLRAEDYKNVTKAIKEYNFYTLIEQLISYGITPVKVNVVLLKGVNDNQIDDYIVLADHFDISVRFIELMDIGDMEYDYETHFIKAHDVIHHMSNLTNKTVEGNTTYFKIEGKKGRIGFINPISSKFCGSCNRIRVTSDGKVRPCLHFNEELDINKTTGADLEEVIEKAINLKPKEHELDKTDGTRSVKSMNKIGG